MTVALFSKTRLKVPAVGRRDTRASSGPRVRRGLRDRDAERRAGGERRASRDSGSRSSRAPGGRRPGSVVSVCVALPIVPVHGVRQRDLQRAAVRRAERAAARAARRCCRRAASWATRASASASTHGRTERHGDGGVGAGGLRDSATPGALRRYSGFAPDDGIADGETISVGAAGVAPGPPGFVTVAVLSIGVAGGRAGRDARVEHDRRRCRSRARRYCATSTRPVPFAPVPAPVDASTAPGGMLTTARLPSSAARSSTTLTPVAATPADSTSVIV